MFNYSVCVVTIADLLSFTNNCTILYLTSYIKLYPVILHDCSVTLSIQDCSFGAELL